METIVSRGEWVKKANKNKKRSKTSTFLNSLPVFLSLFLLKRFL